MALPDNEARHHRRRWRPWLAPLAVGMAVGTAGCVPPFDDAAPPDPRATVLAPATLMRFTAVASDCPASGFLVESGLDEDGDGLLADDEVDGAPGLICAGEDGAPGADERGRLGEAPGCPDGVRVELGRDDNGNAVLDDAEVDRTFDVCPDDDDAIGDARVELADAGTASGCVDGGVVARAGLDADASGTLEGDEVQITTVVCDSDDGRVGDTGPAGKAAAARTTPIGPGTVCRAGGQQVELGFDTSGDGDLDEVIRTVVLCNGEAGLGAGTGPDDVQSEGSVAGPVVVTPGTFEPDDVGAAPHVASVAPLGQSFYVATAPALGGGLTVGLFDVRSALVVRAFTGADFTSGALPVTCIPVRVGVRSCGIADVAADSQVFFVVEELDGRANTPRLTISFGADSGTAIDPLLATLEEDLPIGLRDNGAAHVRFVAADDDAYTVRVDTVRALADAPSLRWTVFEGDVAAATAAVATCPLPLAPWDDPLSPTCPTPPLRAGSRYLVVLEGSGDGAVGTLRVEAGDTITPEIPVGELVTLPVTPGADLPVHVFSSAPGGRFFVHHGARLTTLHATPAATVANLIAGTRLTTGPVAQVLEVTEPRVYLRYRTATASIPEVLVRVEAGGGVEGSTTEPIPITMNVTRRSSAGGAENLQTSVYRVEAAAPTTTRYSVRYDPVVPGLRAQVRGTNDANSAITGFQFFNGAVTEPIAPGVIWRPTVRGAQNPVVFDMTVEPGDTLTERLVLDGAPRTFEAAGTTARKVPDDHVGAAVRVRWVSESAALTQRRLRSVHPSNSSTAGVLATCTAPPCEAAIFVTGDVYVESQGSSTTPPEVVLEAEDEPIGDAALGTPVTGVLEARIENTSRLEVPVAGTLRLLTAFPATATLRVRDATTLAVLQTFTVFTSTSQVSVAVPAGPVLLHVVPGTLGLGQAYSFTPELP